MLVLDVEGTIFRTEIRLPGTSIESTIWQAIANVLGPEAVREEVETHRRWETGAYRNYLEWMLDTIAIHRRHGLSKSVFESLISSAQYNPGVTDTMLRLDRDAYQILLVSGGFRELAARAQRDLGIIHSFAACEYLFGNDGSLVSYNLLPCDFAGKIDFIRLLLKEYKLDPEDWIFVGDGANDVPVARVAPISIGYRPHPELRSVVTHSIEDFRELETKLGANETR